MTRLKKALQALLLLPLLLATTNSEVLMALSLPAEPRPPQPGRAQ